MLTKKKIIVVFLLLLTLGIIAAYYFYNQAPASIKSTDAITVDATALYHAYQNDSANAHRRFSGRVLLVTGIVSGIQKNQQSETVISLQTTLPNAYVNCSLDVGHISVREKQQVSLKGFCSGIGQGDADLGIEPDVYLTRCIIQ